MRPEKRIRLFGGLLCPPGAGVVRPLSSSQPQKVLLAGGDEAIALAPTLRKFAADAGAALIEETVLGSTVDDWKEHRWLDDAIARHRPSLAIVVLAPILGDPATFTIWLPPPGFAVEASENVLPAESLHGWSPTARGYAAWATAAWFSATVRG